jgi:ankyrin repeat protein
VQDETTTEDPSLGALVLAAATGNETVILALLGQGTLVKNRSSFFGSALHAAAEYGHMGVVQIFLRLPTPSYGACIGVIRGGNQEIVERLLDQWQYDPEDDNPKQEKKGLVTYAALPDQTSILDMLIKHPSVSVKEKDLKKALFFAVVYSAKATTKYLLKAGVDINDYEDGHGNGLYIESKRGDLETVRLLVEYGWVSAEGNIGPCSYEEGRHVAAARGHIDVVAFFLHYGVDINCDFPCPAAPAFTKDRDFWDQILHGDPATTNAARNGDFGMFCFLVQRGC